MCVRPAQAEGSVTPCRPPPGLGLPALRSLNSQLPSRCPQSPPLCPAPWSALLPPQGMRHRDFCVLCQTRGLAPSPESPRAGWRALGRPCGVSAQAHSHSSQHTDMTAAARSTCLSQELRAERRHRGGSVQPPPLGFTNRETEAAGGGSEAPVWAPRPSLIQQTLEGGVILPISQGRDRSTAPWLWGPPPTSFHRPQPDPALFIFPPATPQVSQLVARSPSDDRLMSWSLSCHPPSLGQEGG